MLSTLKKWGKIYTGYIVIAPFIQPVLYSSKSYYSIMGLYTECEFRLMLEEKDYSFRK